MSVTKTPLFTGLRPTGDLTIANYLGAIKPMIDLQSEHDSITMFVADLHGLTDQEPEIVAKFRYEIAADYIALGLIPDKATIFLQSAIEEEVLFLTMMLSRHISMSEIMRVPTLKDKLKDPEHPEQARVMLANYPIMMAADILLQNSEVVPVGEDQIAHLEVTRLLARRFLEKYGEAPFYTEPKPYELKTYRIMSLVGQSKMSKSKPKGAILLNESPESAAKKVKRAETAGEGEINKALESHFTVANELARDDEDQKLDDIKARHMAGEKVMGEFKNLFADQVSRFLEEYQDKKSKLDMSEIKALIETGNKKAKANAAEIVSEVKRITGF